MMVDGMIRNVEEDALQGRQENFQEMRLTIADWSKQIIEYENARKEEQKNQ
jgi:hypothetical protein